MRILVPLDGSKHGRGSLQFLAGRKTLIGSNPHIELLNVQYAIPEACVRLLELTAVREAYEDAGRGVFNTLREDIDALGGDVTEKTLHGEAAKVIAKEAEDMDADLVVMGTRGLSASLGFLFGSVSNRVLSRVDKPMLLVRDGTPKVDGKLRVGIAVDGSDYSRKAVAFVLSNLELFGEDATFRLIHATPDYDQVIATSAYMLSSVVPILSREEFRLNQKAEFVKVTEPLVRLFKNAGLQVQAKQVVGDPGRSIAQYAKDATDLLVMGSHGHGNFTAALMGSTAIRLASSTDLPIIVIR